MIWNKLHQLCWQVSTSPCKQWGSSNTRDTEPEIGCAAVETKNWLIKHSAGSGNQELTKDWPKKRAQQTWGKECNWQHGTTEANYFDASKRDQWPPLRYQSDIWNTLPYLLTYVTQTILCFYSINAKTPWQAVHVLIAVVRSSQPFNCHSWWVGCGLGHSCEAQVPKLLRFKCTLAHALLVRLNAS